MKPIMAMRQRAQRYRAWDTIDHRMIYTDPDVTSEYSGHPVDVVNDLLAGAPCDWLVWMQWTGRDANGRDVYEGDVLRGGVVVGNVYEHPWLATHAKTASWFPFGKEA